MELENEYLIIINQESSNTIFTLCNSKERFNELIESDTDLQVRAKEIKFKRKSYKYNVKKGNIKGKKQYFFYLSLGFKGQEKDLDLYRELLRKVKTIFRNDNTIIETLRDDLSFYYSQLAYSLVHNIENLMRKFITYFMIINVGKDWVTESSPEQVKDALDKSKRKQYFDVLQQLDFKHLGDFLFKDYSNKDISLLINKIKTIENKTFDLEELKVFIPQSNWDKYFKDIVECDDQYLKQRWEKIYELRNKIAHTSYFTKGDFDDINLLVNEVKEKLEKAFRNIDKINVLDEDKEQISENIAINVNQDIGEYLLYWKDIEKYLYSFIDDNQNKNKSFLSFVNKLKDNKYFDDIIVNKIFNTYNEKNKLIHELDIIENDKLQSLKNNIKVLNKSIKSTWTNEVVEALKKLGGQATLDEIYNFIKSHTKRELPPSWKSLIRKSIYQYSSDREIFLGKDDLFERVDKGIWKLRNF